MIRSFVACSMAMGSMLVGFVLSQDPTTLQLRGNRFRPLAYSDMTSEQKSLIDHLLASPRQSMDGPFNVMLRSPEMGEIAQQFGAQVRFRSSLPSKLNELAILLTARSWNAQYEWYAHHRMALQAGLSPSIIDAISAGKRPSTMLPEEETVYNFCSELLTTKQVSDNAFSATKRKFGERGIVDLVNVVGYYQLVSALLNVDRYPLPDGANPELKMLN